MLLETISVKYGLPQNLAYHQARLEQSMLSVYGQNGVHNLEKILANHKLDEQIPAQRCRFVFNAERFEIQCFDYHFKQFQNLAIVDIPSNFNYQHKWAERGFFSELLEKHKDFDEVLMIQNGKVTDATIGNIALFDGTNWYCPNTPLLKGTKRQQLLEKGLLKEIEITENDLHNFQKLVVINVFRDVKNEDAIPISKVSRPQNQ